MIDLMELTALIAYAIAIAALAIKPGPGVLAVISRSAERGVMGFTSYMSGAVSGELVYLAIVFFGFSIFEEDLLFISILLKAMASVYLIYLGVQTLTKPPEIDFNDHGVGIAESNWKDFSTGLMLTLSNPFVIIVFGGIIPEMVGQHDATMTQFIILALVTIVVQVSIDFMYCFPVFISRRLFNKKAVYRLGIASGVIMILIGLYLGYSALPANDLKSVIH